VRLSPDMLSLFGELLGWPFFLKDLWTFLIETLMRDTRNTQTAPVILLNLPRLLARVV